jgi:hypothetical protein
VRDDFNRQTIAEIAKGVGYRCSTPECRRPTVGANAVQDGIVTIGVAAHICAASRGGPRYDSAQTREARRAKENGIWLCQNCGRLIDADERKFTIDVLLGWKHDAQACAFRALVVVGSSAATEEADRVGAIIAAEHARPGDVEDLFARVHAAAGADLDAYKRVLVGSDGSIELTLRLHGDDDVPPFTISRLPLAVELAPEIAIVAAPGTGKTTTLLQLAGKLLAADAIIPIYFRLGEWLAGVPRLLASLRERLTFKDIGEDDVRQLAEHGRLLLLLDGWNEIDPAMRKQVRIQIEQVRRDYPDIRIVVTTRRQMLDVPIAGPRIAIEPLSEDQQMAIARANFGTAGETIVDEAWRTSGVRDLIATPLYLWALLSGGAQGVGPTTKDDVLRFFVQEHERASDHAEALQSALFGCHAEILTTLASELNAAGSTTMSETDARRTVMVALAHLREEGQMSGQPEPSAVLEALASHHTLVRSGTGDRGFIFQHQQFQEWYASHAVAQLIRASAKGDIGARSRLRAAVFDQPAWEESILFAVERVSREEPGVAAHAVQLALPVDPMLAAEMIYRAAPPVWQVIGSEMIAFIDRWHAPGTVDRAVRFMIMTGRPEFAPRIWPLASSANTQVQLPTLRAAPRFRPSVLGPDLREKVAALPDPIREHLLASIAAESGVDGMDLVTEIAKRDPSPKVQAEVLQALQFRRAERHVASLLESAREETWVLVARRGYAEGIRAPAVARLQAEREKALANVTAPLDRLRLLLRGRQREPERDAGITAALADSAFPVRDQDAGTVIYLAQQQAPAAVREGLRKRLEAGLLLPFHTYELLNELEIVDDGPIAASILDVGSDNRYLNAVAVMAGPKTILALVDQFLTCVQALKAARGDRGLSDLHSRLQSRIGGTRANSFVTALMARADTDDADRIAALATLASSHGGFDKRNVPLPVDPALKAELIGTLRRWVEAVLASSDAGRYQLNEVSNAIAAFGLSELLPELQRLLNEELGRLRKSLGCRMEALRRGDSRAASDAAMRYSNQYGAAFARIGGDEAAIIASEYLEDRLFGGDAALILKAISDKQVNAPAPSIHRQWPRYEEVAAARAHRAVSPKRELAHWLADPIFAAIDRLAKPDTDQEGQLLAIQLARIALGMPHTERVPLIARVLALPQPVRAKWQLLAAMALDGEVLDADLVMRGVNEWLAEAPRNAWHKRQNTWEIEPWLELLPFTTQPESVLEGLTKVKAFYGKDWAKRWERVLRAVAGVPGPEGEKLLAALARTHKDIASDFEWMKALLGRESPAAVLLYVDLYIDGVFGRDRHGASAWHVARELAEYVQKFPQLKAELKKRYEDIGSDSGSTLLEQFFSEAGSDDDLIAMIGKYAAVRRSYDGVMANAVRAVSLRREPVPGGANSFHIYPAPVAPLRKFLFGLLDGVAWEAALAKSCLIAIDALRDEHGMVANDARHPDVFSGLPWPSEAAEPPARGR